MSTGKAVKMACCAALSLWLMGAGAVFAASLEAVSLTGDEQQLQLQLRFDGEPAASEIFLLEQPAQLVVDLYQSAAAASLLEQLALREPRLSAAVSGADLRLVVQLPAPMSFVERRDSDQLTVVMTPRSTAASRLEGLDFRPLEAGAGQLQLVFAGGEFAVDVERNGNQLELQLLGSDIEPSLLRKLDVSDFATPVQQIGVAAENFGARITLTSNAPYDYLLVQRERNYLVTIRPQQRVEQTQQRGGYSGERLSLNFQDIEVRSVLQIIADFTGFNLVASDAVRGSVTLRLDNVPWDQALDIVLRAKGLDKRREGNVIMVAPAAEIAEQERQRLEAGRQLQELAPLRSAFLRIKYAAAEDIHQLLQGGGESARLSERGSAMVDQRTNTLIINDTEDKLRAIEQLVAEIDVPIRQVLIEARIVIASTDFSKELGVSWGFAGVNRLKGGLVTAPGDKTVGFSGRRSGLAPGGGVIESFSYDSSEISSTLYDPDFDPATANSVVQTDYQRNFDFALSDSLAVDLAVAEPSAAFAVGFLTDDFFIDMELSALESDGMAEIVSQPKVLTGDKQQASIKSGTEIAYRKASSSGATAVEFKEAVLQLQVTPQITPDDRIIMDLKVSQDSVGAFTPTGEPSIDVTAVETQALVANGQTLVLGGIFQTEELNAVDKVPLLGDLPWLGKLFRSEARRSDKREVLIFITPKIVDDTTALDPAASGSMPPGESL